MDQKESVTPESLVTDSNVKALGMKFAVSLASGLLKLRQAVDDKKEVTVTHEEATALCASLKLLSEDVIHENR